MLLIGIVVALGGPLAFTLSSQVSGQQQGIASGLQQQKNEAGVLVSVLYSTLNSGNLVLQTYNYGFSTWAPALVYVDKATVTFTLKDAVTGNAVASATPGEEVGMTLTGQFGSSAGHSVLILDQFGEWITIRT